MSFFKGLVDILNHEHWGIPEQRHELLSVFEAHYGISIEDDVLRSIDSIEFTNSICIIRRGGSDASALGPRVVAGTTASVVKVPAGLNGSRMSHPPQPGNSWIDRQVTTTGESSPGRHGSYLAPPEHVSLAIELAQRDMQISKLTGELRALENDRFWRLTAPARRAVEILKKYR